MTCTYRDHGALLAMGAPADRCMAEILGKADGVCGGIGGSMHLTDISVGALGSFAIVGAHLPFACGTALAAVYRGTEDVSVAMFGDGTTNIGVFHEAMNLAAIWRLPVVFVCENNLYGEYSPLATTTPVDRLADRAASYAMPARTIDGNDVLAVRAATLEALERARSGDGPTFLEALTYRQRGHSRSDPGAYRPEGELERWLERDPIVLFESALVARGLADAPALAHQDAVALGQVGLEGERRARRPAIGAVEETAAVQVLEVPAHGLRMHAQTLGDLRGADRRADVQLCYDPLLSLALAETVGLVGQGRSLAMRGRRTGPRNRHDPTP
jgi:pyruvate dehydrogenase E1 component alpha subunit